MAIFGESINTFSHFLLQMVNKIYEMNKKANFLIEASTIKICTN